MKKTLRREAERAKEDTKKPPGRSLTATKKPPAKRRGLFLWLVAGNAQNVKVNCIKLRSYGKNLTFEIGQIAPVVLR